MDVKGSTLQVSMLIAKNRQYKIMGNQEIIEGFETQEVLGLKLIYHFSDPFLFVKCLRPYHHRYTPAGRVE